MTDFPSIFSAGIIHDGATRFRVWAPGISTVELVIGKGRTAMDRAAHGFWEAEISEEKTIYSYCLDGDGPYPDPSSRYQPEGVNGPSFFSTSFLHHEDVPGWRGIRLRDMVIQEMHTGTYTAQGTFSAASGKLDRIASTGINAIEIMPVAQTYGDRNWGYDGVFPYSVNRSYGTPDDFAEFVKASHEYGIAVILDVVFNHMGPIGNYLEKYGPYFSDQHSTPWGKALNFDGPGSDAVRRYVIDSALYWLETMHIDGLRFDATHAIYDSSPVHILKEVVAYARRLEKNGRRIVLIAEDNRNDSNLVRSQKQCGYGFDAIWADDFHHVLHVGLTGERASYYSDYTGLDQLCRVMEHGVVYDGLYSEHLQRIRGNSWNGVAPWHSIVFSQNHDQIGNRACGERLSSLVSPDAARFAAACVLLSPCTPMLFMGEEYGERNPFLFFIDAPDMRFAELVREGRLREFRAFGWNSTADPADPETFTRCKLSWSGSDDALKASRYYSDLIKIRRKYSLAGKRPVVICGEGRIDLDYGNVTATLCTPRAQIRSLSERPIFNSEWRRYGGSTEDGSAEIAPGYFAAVCMHAESG